MTIEMISPTEKEASLLVDELDRTLDERYPESPKHTFDAVGFENAGGYFVVAREEDRLLGCGSFRPISTDCAEIKRMYVRPDFRQRGVARQILRHLEDEVRRRGY